MPLDNDPRPTFPGEGLPDEPGYSPNAAQLTADAQAPDPFEGYTDYYGFDERARWYFPDGKQWIEFKKLNEGDRAKYLKATRSDVRLDRGTGEARIPFDQSGDRKALLLHSITDWQIARKNAAGKFELVPFPVTANQTPGGVLGLWIDKANPAILGQLEKAIRMANPWLLNEMSAEQIRKEIEDLQELLVAAEERELREKAS